MKKIFSLLGICLLSVFFMTGCGNKMVHVEGNLENLMTKVYAGIDEKELPRGLQNIELNKDNQVSFIGESSVNYEKAIASESPIGSIAHSVILIRMPEKSTAEDVEKAMNELKDKVDPRKWICVGVEEVHVESNGDLILVVLDDDHANTLIENFKNLK